MADYDPWTNRINLYFRQWPEIVDNLPKLLAHENLHWRIFNILTRHWLKQFGFDPYGYIVFWKSIEEFLVEQATNLLPLRRFLF
jgi:hypothetical protein